MISFATPTTAVSVRELSDWNHQGGPGGTRSVNTTPDDIVTDETGPTPVRAFVAPAVVQVPLFDRAGNQKTTALIDADDWPSVARLRWRLTAEGVVNEHGGTLPRFILCPEHDQEVVNLNGNDLDCRRTNLRVVDCEPLSVRLQMSLRLLLEKMAVFEGVTPDTIVARLIAREFGHAVR